MTKLLTSQYSSQFELIQSALKNSSEKKTGSQNAFSGITNLEKELLTEANNAVKAWKASQRGQQVLNNSAQLSSQDWESVCKEMLASSFFDKTHSLIKQQTQLSVTDISIPIQSLSIGIIGQIDAGIGLVGSIGYAFNIDDYGQTASVCIGGGVTEGLEVGGDVGIELTFWNLSADDIQGYFNCQEAMIDEGIGLSGISYEHDKSLVGISVGAEVGVNDGVSEWEYYIVTFSVNHYPVYQDSNGAHFFIMGELVCENSNSLSMNHDEVSLTFRPDGSTTYRYPEWDSYSMSEQDDDADHKWNLGRSVKYNNSVVISLDVQANDLDPVTVNWSDFANNDTITKTFYRDGSIGNGWNEIKYTLKITSIY